ncbi:protein MET1, chloroplastic-like [Pyrus communis]|uniref:protein MET1, chloroplastic-like n=1 Tax=Pyrus communis TaxID=23211 RepID=UPI0035C262F7
MSQAVLAAASSSSSCFPTFNRHHSTRTPQVTTPKQLPPIQCQKSSFQGLSLGEAKRGVLYSLVADLNNGSGLGNNVRRGLRVTARTAGAAKSIEAEVDKPLGLTLGQKPGGPVTITAVDGGGNAAKAGLKAGDQVIYTSSFFGDELWPADKLGFTKTAINAKPDSVYFVVSRGGAAVDVKRLPKRPAPPRFGRKLTEAQKARATHICLDCGFIYTLQKPFDEQPDSYTCPQCLAPKKRFAQYDVNTGKAIGGGLPPIGVIIGLAVGLAGVGALLVYGLQ